MQNPVLGKTVDDFSATFQHYEIYSADGESLVSLRLISGKLLIFRDCNVGILVFKVFSIRKLNCFNFILNKRNSVNF